MTSKITNVGIKEEQKKEIRKIIDEKVGKYISINQFSQEAIRLLILKESSKKRPKKEEELDALLSEIQSLVEKMLEEELEDKICITASLAEGVSDILHKIKEFRISFKWEDKTQQLISAIEVKDDLNLIREEIEECNEGSLEPKIPKEYLETIKDLKKRFIDLVKSLKGKPVK